MANFSQVQMNLGDQRAKEQADQAAYEQNAASHRAADDWAAKQQAAAAAKVDQYAGMPTLGTGTLASQFQVKPGQVSAQPSNIDELKKQLGGINLNTQGLEAIRTKALAQGPSAWANLATQKQQGDEQLARNQQTQAQGSQDAAARGNLAMQGGLSSGARERLATAGANAGAAAQQSIGQAGQQARLGIGMQDETNKNAMLTQLPGMEIQALQPGFQKTNAWQNMAQNEAQQKQQAQEFNTSNDMAAQQFNSQAGQAANQNAYQEQMKAWAAGKQADATQKSGK